MTDYPVKNPREVQLRYTIEVWIDEYGQRRFGVTTESVWEGTHKDTLEDALILIRKIEAENVKNGWPK